MYKTRHRTNPSHPILKGPENQIDELFSEICGIKTEEELNKMVDSFSEWVGKQDHFVVKDIDRNYLEGFIYGCGGSLELAKQFLDKRLTLTTLIPEVLTNIDLAGGSKDLFSSYMCCAMPVSKDKFYRIIINKYQGPVVKLDVYELMKYWVTQLEYHLMNDAVIGSESVFDLEEANLGDILVKFTPPQLKKILTILTNGYRMKIKAVHILSGSKFVDALLTMLKSVLSAKLLSRIHIHSSKESLVESIGKEYLPSDYGGSQNPLLKLNALYYAQLTSARHARHMATVQTYCTDETRRAAAAFSAEYAGMPGSFRSLSVD